MENTIEYIYAKYLREIKKAIENASLLELIEQRDFVNKYQESLEITDLLAEAIKERMWLLEMKIRHFSPPFPPSSEYNDSYIFEIRERPDSLYISFPGSHFEVDSYETEPKNYLKVIYSATTNKIIALKIMEFASYPEQWVRSLTSFALSNPEVKEVKDFLLGNKYDY